MPNTDWLRRLVAMFRDRSAPCDCDRIVNEIWVAEHRSGCSVFAWQSDKYISMGKLKQIAPDIALGYAEAVEALEELLEAGQPTAIVTEEVLARLNAARNRAHQALATYERLRGEHDNT